MTTSVNALDTETDATRANRLFVGLVNSIVGSDQNYIGQDGNPINPTGQFSIANPDGSMSVMGIARSNQQSVASSATGINLPVIAVACLAAYMLLKKGKS